MVMCCSELVSQASSAHRNALSARRKSLHRVTTLQI
jgi:hypothetical protein